MKTRTVLLVGGPCDGHRVQVEEFAKFVTMSSFGCSIRRADDEADPRDTYPALHYQITSIQGPNFKGYIATLGTDPRDPMQILFEEYGKAGA